MFYVDCRRRELKIYQLSLLSPLEKKSPVGQQCILDCIDFHLFTFIFILTEDLLTEDELTEDVLTKDVLTEDALTEDALTEDALTDILTD